MSWFNENETIYPTKMFVNYLSEVPQTKGMNFSKTRSFSTSMLTAGLGTYGVAIDMVMTAAPKIIDSGMALMSKTISTMAEKQMFPTTVKRNFDVINPAKISLPSKITLVRGNFATDVNEEGITFGDGEKKSTNQATLMGNKELHIEIDIIKSRDNRSIYFQPSSYFYCGHNKKGDAINELVLAIAFVPPGETLLDTSKLTFQNFLHFEALTSNKQYNFKSKSGYDSSFQSVWMNAPLADNLPYTMVVQIQEIRSGNSFAKLLQTVYLENESYIKTGITNKVNTLKDTKHEE